MTEPNPAKAAEQKIFVGSSPAVEELRQLLAPQRIQAEFTIFYRSEVPSLVAFLMWLGASTHDAADVAQETMLDLYQQWDSVETRHAWVRRVASRKFGRRLGQLEQPTADAVLTPLLRDDPESGGWEQEDEVIRHLSQLPLRQRQVMAWYYDGYAASEIAVELQISEDAVRGSLKKARRALRLAGLGDGGEQ